MAKDDLDFGSRAKPVTPGTIPAVYLFQPAYYVVLENDELDEWQRRLEKKVGMTKSDIDQLQRQGLRGQATYCLCDSTALSEACDCDEM